MQKSSSSFRKSDVLAVWLVLSADFTGTMNSSRCQFPHSEDAAEQVVRGTEALRSI